MITVKDIMTTELVTFSPDDEIAKATKILLEKRFNGAPVVDSQGKLVGILCQSDLIAQQKSFPIPTIFTVFDGFIPLTSVKHLEKEVEKISAALVSQAMTPDPVTVRPETEIEKVAKLMVDKNFHTLPVVDENGNLIGIIGKHDILKTLIKDTQQ
ncbi:MAG TPA: CBS domain-containing protein [Desulfomonilia bacterium]|jgi:CBS-domain-containing membrane protein